MTADITGIRALIQSKHHFIIAGHQNPDGDAVGACFGLALALKKLGKDVKVVLEPYSVRYNIIPGRRLLYDGSLNELRAEVLFCLDCAETNRLGAAQCLTNKAEATVCIDHHMTNAGYAQYNYIDSAASSTSEMVYKLLHTEPALDIDIDIASALYAGLVSDTGGFRHAATSQDTLRIAGQLIETGILFTDIYTELVHLHSFDEAKLFSRALDACRLCCGNRAVYACVTREMMTAVSSTGKPLTGQELDGVVEYLLNIRGVEIAALIYDKNEGEVKISFRSRNIDVGRLAAGLGGGGHKLAAGCNVFGDIFAVRDQVLPLLEQALQKEL